MRRPGLPVWPGQSAARFRRPRDRSKNIFPGVSPIGRRDTGAGEQDSDRGISGVQPSPGNDIRTLVVSEGG